MTPRLDEAPLAETLWRLGAVVPWFGGAGLTEVAEPSSRHPVALSMLRSLEQERREALQGALTMTDTAIRHALDAGQRLMEARDPVAVMVAQTGLALAMGEFAGAPIRAWLDALPKLHDCCMDAVTHARDAGQIPDPERRSGPAGTGPVVAKG